MKSLWPRLSLCLYACASAPLSPLIKRSATALSLSKTAGPRWGCHGATRGRGARAHARPLRRGGSQDRPVWNAIPGDGWPWLAPQRLSPSPLIVSDLDALAQMFQTCRRSYHRRDGRLINLFVIPETCRRIRPSTPAVARRNRTWLLFPGPEFQKDTSGAAAASTPPFVASDQAMSWATNPLPTWPGAAQQTAVVWELDARRNQHMLDQRKEAHLSENRWKKTTD